MEVINLNPFDEKDLIDKRKDIAENCFAELDIVIKSYQKEYGEDYISAGISLTHSTLAYILVQHRNKHKLSSIDIEKFRLPNNIFKDNENNDITELSKLSDLEKLHFYTNLVINSKQGIDELLNSSYFNDEEYQQTKLFLPLNKLIVNLLMQYDNILLLLNNKYNKIILNFN
jgi:hypothetical protein